MSATPPRPRRADPGADIAKERPSAPKAAARRHGIRVRLRELYSGWSPRAVRFRYGLLVFDLVTIGFVIVSSFFHGAPEIEALDVVFGVLILVDFCARLLASRSPLSELVHPLGMADVIVIVSFLAPLAGENFAFLRIVRALRLFRSYQLVNRLRQDFPWERSRSLDRITVKLQTAALRALQHRLQTVQRHRQDESRFLSSAICLESSDGQ